MRNGDFVDLWGADQPAGKKDIVSPTPTEKYLEILKGLGEDFSDPTKLESARKYIESCMEKGIEGHAELIGELMKSVSKHEGRKPENQGYNYRLTSVAKTALVIYNSMFDGQGKFKDRPDARLDQNRDGRVDAYLLKKEGDGLEFLARDLLIIFKEIGGKENPGERLLTGGDVLVKLGNSSSDDCAFTFDWIPNMVVNVELKPENRNHTPPPRSNTSGWKDSWAESMFENTKVKVVNVMNMEKK